MRFLDGELEEGVSELGEDEEGSMAGWSSAGTGVYRTPHWAGEEASRIWKARTVTAPIRADSLLDRTATSHSLTYSHLDTLHMNNALWCAAIFAEENPCIYLTTPSALPTTCRPPCAGRSL